MATQRTLSRARSRSRRSGFTLMEVLLVMAILVIMGTLVVANFSGILFKSKAKSAKIQLQALGKALELYQIDMNAYPDPADGLENAWIELDLGRLVTASEIVSAK